MAKIENPKNWFVKLFTLGRTFSSKTFSDNFKKYFLEFVGLFLVVTFSFYVESVGQDYEDRVRYFNLLNMLKDDLTSTNEYLKDYYEQNKWVTDMYLKQYRNWDIDNDSIFLEYEEADDFLYAPLAFYNNRDPFLPPALSFILFEKGTQDFLMVEPQTTLEIENLYADGSLEYIKINSDEEELKFIEEFNSIINTKWALELEEIDLENNDFWIINRRYIQNDKQLKYNLFKRIELWLQIKEQLDYYSEKLEKTIRHIDSVSIEYNKEKYFLYWRIN